MMSMHTLLRFIKQISKLNNSFDIENCCVVVWLSFTFVLSCGRSDVIYVRSVLLVDVEFLILFSYIILLLYDLCAREC